METKSHQRYHDEDGRNTALLTTELGFFNGRFDGRGAAQAPELMHGRRGVGAFRGCALLCIVIPPAIRAIKARGYRDCSGLTTVILNNWLEEIGMWALDECRSLVRAKIPLGIRAIKNFAFYSCLGLTTVTLNDRLEVIGLRTFCNYWSLVRILKPHTVWWIKDGAFWVDQI